MRLLIDLQGAQSASRLRGIGRYCLALALELVRQAGDDEVHLLLNGMLGESVEPLRAAFDGLLPQSHIHVWEGVGPVAANQEGNEARRAVAEQAREAFVQRLMPDVLLHGSLFEGYGDDAVTSLGRWPWQPRHAVILYDLIPFLHAREYLSEPSLASWYQQKLDHLRRADALLAISASTAEEARRHLGFPAHRVHAISAAVDHRFRPGTVGAAERARMAARWGLVRPFVLYTTGGDTRKNNENLIAAWARLPAAVRDRHQLLLLSSSIVGGIVEELHAARSRTGLAEHEVLLVNGCSDEELVALYRACKLFVFPSRHEGFGLPALEAMACGRAVIASGTSSLPELLARPDALFDPLDVGAMASRIAQLLESDALRTELEAHGQRRAAEFSWEACGTRAWDALRSLAHVPAAALAGQPGGTRQRLLYAPLPDAASAEARELERLLLVELARLHELDLLLSGAAPSAGAPFGTPRALEWVLRHGDRYAAIVIPFGGAEVPAETLQVLQRWPAVTLMLEAFSTPVRASAPGPGALRDLVLQQGWPAVHRAVAGGLSLPLRRHGEWLAQGAGLLVFDEVAESAAQSALGPVLSVHRLPLPALPRPSTRAADRRALALEDDALVVCVPVAPGAGDGVQGLVKSWRRLGPPSGWRLVLMGDVAVASAADVVVTGPLTEAARELWLGAADLCLVLRDPQLQPWQRWQRLLGHLARPVATAAEVSAGEAPCPEAVLPRFDTADTAGLERLLARLGRQPQERTRQIAAAAEWLCHEQPLRRFGEALAAALARFAVARPLHAPAVLGQLRQAAWTAAPVDHAPIVNTVVRNFPQPGRRPQLLVDISELVQRDARTGIQRVVRAVLGALLTADLRGFELQPVYASEHGPPGYRRALAFMAGFVGTAAGGIEDDAIEAWPGDVFLGLDYQPVIVPMQAEVLRRWRRRGVRLHFVVYDLLPLLRPDCFPGDGPERHARWLRLAAEADGLLCISRAVADEAADWLEAFGPSRPRPLAIDWVHLGADLERSAPTRGIPPDAPTLQTAMGLRPTLLMVGTLEPRKGQEQALRACELLWGDGIEVNLVIVGRFGWQVDELVSLLRHHEQRGSRLFWIEDASDEYLQLIYKGASALLAASEAEGFGLPIVEGARHGLDVVCRDIPVFREVAGDTACYFPDSPEPASLAHALRGWLDSYNPGTRRTPPHGPSWQACAEGMLDRLAGTAAYRRCQPPRWRRRWGNDPDARSEVGRRRNQVLQTQGGAGLMWAWRSETLAPGEHILALELAVATLDGSERLLVRTVDDGAALVACSLGSADTRPAQVQLGFSLAAAAAVECRLEVGTCTDLALLASRLQPAP